MLLLPAQTSEWNPVGLIWSVLVQRLVRFPVHSVQMIGEYLIGHIAHDSLCKIMFDEVYKIYKHCYSA